jgi:DNA-binding NarL/FixJ family response regulator
MRQGLVRLLQESPDMEVVGEAGDGQEALDLVRRLSPDAVVMDVDMPRVSGIEATAQLTKEFPQLKIIALSMWDESERGAAMSNAGAVAYVNKADPPEALIDTIRRCARAFEKNTAKT